MTSSVSKTKVENAIAPNVVANEQVLLADEHASGSARARRRRSRPGALPASSASLAIMTVASAISATKASSSMAP